MRQPFPTTCDRPVTTGATRAVGTALGVVGYADVERVRVGGAVSGAWRDLPMHPMAHRSAALPIDIPNFAKAPKAPKAPRPPRGSP
jgi:hypothetical protein